MTIAILPTKINQAKGASSQHSGHEEGIVKFKAPLPNADAMAWNPFSLTSERNKSCWFANRALFALISRMTP
jgi:hypothetical protein